MSNPKLFRTIDKAVQEYNMIGEDDNILLAASGGKDSTALAEYLSFRKRRSRFYVKALHISTEFENANLEKLKKLFSGWDIELQIQKISVFDRLRADTKMSCWWCSTQRRSELFKFAVENGFNKIAFGHHLDDILETVFMNIFTKGKLSGMPPILKFEKLPITIIRPLAFADLNMIKKHIEKSSYVSFTCTCAYQSQSHRKIARKQLQLATDGKYDLKLKLFNSLKKENINLDYLH